MRISAYYVALFATVGVLLPFLPPYFRSLGFSGQEIALLAVLGNALMMIVPPLWGFLADRAGVTNVLRLAAIGAALVFAPMLAVTDLVAVALVLAAHGVFFTPIAALADTVAVIEARRLGTEFARLRLWGSIGFVVASFSFAILLERRGDPADVIRVAAALLVAGAIIAQFVRPTAAAVARPSLAEARRLARNPALLAFLAAGAIHWAAAAPYHVFFAVHLEDLGAAPRWIGLGIAGAVAAEVVVMWAFGAFRRRIPLFGLMAISFAGSAVRWGASAVAESGPILAALQLLHGLTFGLFYVASIGHLERVVPERLRATGRALFASIVTGFGGVAGGLLAGAMYDAGGGRLAFAVAALLQLLAPLLLWVAARSPFPTASTEPRGEG